ncbi:MAG: MFS transporter [Anaerolineae bacterium]|nr:MFS transporter [Anaerolineae bacterium]
MTVNLTDVEKIRKLPWLAAGDVLNVAFVSLTFAGSVFILFLDELGLDTIQIGVLLSLIPFANIVAPFIAPIVTRFGYKRIYVMFWGIRKLFMAMLLLTPAFLARFGPNSAFMWVGGVLLGFALCRSTAETGGFPWRKELVPDSIRGKFTAITSVSSTVAGIIVTAGASYVVEFNTGLGRFMLLIGIGVGIGLLAVFCYSRMPAESRLPLSDSNPGHLQGMKQALQDRNFRLFLAVLGLATIGGTSIVSFIPLFMKEQIGLSDGVIVLLSIGTFVGALLTSYLWGWTADRYGTKPVMQTSLALMLLLPVAWFILPRHSEASAPLAMFIAFLVGIGTLAWQISWTRYIFVNATPTENRTPYMAVFYAWFGLVSGFGPLLAGQILNWTAGLEMTIAFFTIDPFTPLFAMSLILLAIGFGVVPLLRSDTQTTFKRFAGMFLRGNPVRTLALLIQYNFAGDEMTRLSTTERMGDTHNPLSSLELIEALNDPSFNVRYEAIHSIGRLPPEPELVEALIGVLQKGESELSIVATRSLGRLGDRRAIAPLRHTLVEGSRLVQANSARALAMLGDVESIPHFLEKLRTEPNSTLRVAYASALGTLQAVDDIAELTSLLREIESESLRAEVGLALARLVGDERYYLQQWRALQANLPTAAAQAILALQKVAKPLGLAAWEPATARCSHAFAQGHLPQGAEALADLIDQLPIARLDPALAHLLQVCRANLADYGGDRLEYLLLALHGLDAALAQLQSGEVYS